MLLRSPILLSSFLFLVHRPRLLSSCLAWSTSPLRVIIESGKEVIDFGRY